MKAVRFVTFLMFVLLCNLQTVGAQESGAASGGDDMYQINLDNLSDESHVDSAVKPYEGPIDDNAATTETTKEPAAPADTEVVPADETKTDETPAQDASAPAETETNDTSAPAAEDKAAAPAATEQAAESKEELDPAVADVIKAEVTKRKKASGKLDLYDVQANKVRTLDLINLRPEVKKDGDLSVVTGDFRDTSSGDVVALDIKLTGDAGSYAVKEMTIASVTAAPVQEIKAEYTDDEVKTFMKEYVDTQAQATGSFDLYDEKAKNMRSLELVKVDDKLRRYGIIAIATAEFKDKKTGDTVFVDINTENKEGLSVTAMRLKSVKKAPAPAAPAAQ